VSLSSPQSLARVAAWCTVGLIVLGPVGLVVVPGMTTVPGDLAATAALQAESPWLVRLGLGAELGVVGVELILVTALWGLFRRVHREGAALATAARLSMTVMQAGCAAVGFAALAVFMSPELDPGLAGTLLEVRTAGNLVWQLIFGVHCLVLGALVVRSGWFPWVLGALMGVAGASYLGIGVGSLIWPDSAETLAGTLGIAAALGEIPLYAWMLFRPLRTSD